MKTERFEIWVAGATALLIAVCAIGVSATFNQANAEDPEVGKPANEASDPGLLDDSNQAQTRRNQPIDQQHQLESQRVEQDDSQRHTAHYARAEGGKHGCRASKIIGMIVRSKSGDDDVGSIDDLMIGEDGNVKYAAVSFGGFLGMGDKLFAVPWDQIHVEKSATDEDETYARIDVSEQTLRNRQGFDQNKWPEEADNSFEVGARPSTQQQEVQR